MYPRYCFAFCTLILCILVVSARVERIPDLQYESLSLALQKGAISDLKLEELESLDVELLENWDDSSIEPRFVPVRQIFCFD